MLQKLLKLRKTTKYLLLGILLFLFGSIGPSRYEQAKETGYEVEATVVEVRNFGIFPLYGDYTVNGKTYTHVKLKTYEASGYVGEKVNVVVDPDHPDRTISEGGFLGTVGFVMANWAIIQKIKNKRYSANTTSQ